VFNLEKASDGRNPCPRCGGRLQRRRRRFVHRLISALYPVRSYVCPECDWQGLLTSQTRLERRKGYIKAVLVVVLLVLAAGLIVHKYGKGLSWRHRSPPSDGIEEDVSGTPEQ
jgi:hypothetical protein